MGNQSSTTYAENDYELAIKSAKELEHILEADFGASGKGLHEKITAAAPQLSQQLVKRMRYLATIRNKLVHERGFDKIPDRGPFIRAFEESEQELSRILVSRGKRTSDYTCIIC